MSSTEYRWDVTAVITALGAVIVAAVALLIYCVIVQPHQYQQQSNCIQQLHTHSHAPPEHPRHCRTSTSLSDTHTHGTECAERPGSTARLSSVCQPNLVRPFIPSPSLHFHLNQHSTENYKASLHPRHIHVRTHTSTRACASLLRC